MEKLEVIKGKIVDFHTVAKETCGTACNTALLAKNFVIDERIVSETKGNIYETVN